MAGLLAAGFASAATLEERQAAARERIERTSAAIEAGRADLEAARSRAATAAQEESDIAALLATGQERSATLAARLEQAESALAAAKKRLARARGFLADRLVAIYMHGGDPEALDFALGIGSFDQLVSGTEYLTAIQKSSDRLMKRVSDLRRQLDGRVDGLSEAKLAVEQHNAALSTARDTIADARAQAESSAARLASANAEREGQVRSLKSDIAGWQKQIEKQQRVSARQAEEAVEQHLGGPYSIPTYIVMCESGGNYSALNPSSGAGGAYQIIPSTWEYYGGKGLPHLASKAEQDRIAALIWENDGPGAWVCA